MRNRKFPSYAWKWNFYDKDIIPMWVADMDFTPDLAIQEALSSYSQNQFYGYGLTENKIFEAIRNWISKQYNFNIKKEEILLCSGVISAMKSLMSAYLKPNDNYITLTPIYPPFLNMETSFPIQTKQVPLDINLNHSYSLNFEKIEQAMNHKTKFLLLSNPHNPTGNIWSKKELTQILHLCQKYNVRICSDEIWSDLIFEKNIFNSFYSLKNEDLSLVTCFFSPSKSFNIAGLNFSYTIVKNLETKQKMETFLKSFSAPSNIIGELATYTAYTQSEEWLKNTISILKSNFIWAQNFIKEHLPQLKITYTQATYLMWIDCSALKIKDPYQFFLSEAKVAFRHAKDFGENYNQWVRLNIACDKNLLEKALKRIYDATNNIK